MECYMMSRARAQALAEALRKTGVPQLIHPIVRETVGICRKKLPRGVNTACIYAPRGL